MIKQLYVRVGTTNIPIGYIKVNNRSVESMQIKERVVHKGFTVSIQKTNRQGKPFFLSMVMKNGCTVEHKIVWEKY